MARTTPRARACDIPSAWRWSSRRTSRSTNRSFTRPAPSVTSRACPMRQVCRGSSTQRPMPTAFFGACRCSSSTTAVCTPRCRWPRWRWPPAHGRPRSRRQRQQRGTAHRRAARRPRPHRRCSMARATCCCAIAARSDRFRISAGDVLAGRANPKTFANKIVFVGTTALGTREVVATPIDTLFAGVEIHATAADNLLQGDFLSRPEHRIALETQLVIGLGVLAVLFFLRFGLMWGLLATVASGAGLWGTSYMMLSTSGTFFSPLYPTMGFSSRARRDDRGRSARRTSTRRQVGAGERRLPTSHGSDAVVVDGHPRFRDGQALGTDAEIHTRDRAAALKASVVSGLSDARAHRAARQPRAASRHRQGWRS